LRAKWRREGENEVLRVPRYTAYVGFEDGRPWWAVVTKEMILKDRAKTMAHAKTCAENALSTLGGYRGAP
jgi:hypothetical protein